MPINNISTKPFFVQTIPSKNEKTTTYVNANNIVYVNDLKNGSWEALVKEGSLCDLTSYKLDNENAHKLIDYKA